LIDIEKLAEDAVAAFGAESVERDATTVRIDLDDATVAFVVREEDDVGVLCRAFVSALTRVDDPAALCREALEANFFWRGTDGATLSVNPSATALYLTERLPPGEVDGPEALYASVDRFVEQIVAWRLRVRAHQGGLEALPASADFTLSPEDEAEVAEAEGSEDAEEAISNGLEVFR